MNKKNVLAFIIESAQKRGKLLGISDLIISGTTDLMKEGIYDSLSFVDLIVDCENKFNVQIEIEKCKPADYTRIDKLANLIVKELT